MFVTALICSCLTHPLSLQRALLLLRAARDESHRSVVLPSPSPPSSCPASSWSTLRQDSSLPSPLLFYLTPSSPLLSIPSPLSRFSCPFMSPVPNHSLLPSLAHLTSPLVLHASSCLSSPSLSFPSSALPSSPFLPHHFPPPVSPPLYFKSYRMADPPSLPSASHCFLPIPFQSSSPEIAATFRA